MKHSGHDSHHAGAGTVTAVWAVLVAATLAGWLLSGGASGGDLRLAGLVIIACAKIYLVMAVFMGLWRAPVGWHSAALAWLALTGGIVFLLAAGGVP